MTSGLAALMRRFRKPVFGGGILSAALLSVAAGCAAPALPVRPTMYHIDVRIDPEAHTLSGRTTVHLTWRDEAPTPLQGGAIELKLHPDLKVSDIDVAGAEYRGHRVQPFPATGDHPGVRPSTHAVLVDRPTGEMAVTLRYEGILHQDVSAGEEQGQIHNFLMAAHVSPEGIYLDGSGYWHPVVALPDDADPAMQLADFHLSVDPIDGFELVASADRPVVAMADAKLHWATSVPDERMVLLGGPLQRWTTQHGDTIVHAVLAPDKQDVAEDILDYIGELMDRYPPLLGPYPYREFTLLEAFFSSGFAFPTCTQIAGSRLNIYKPYRRHGYIDHEMVHSWWGCGVYVDPRDGNWCEALTAYCTNYYGHVLDEDEGGARKTRRNYSNFLSDIKPEDDKPLGTYGLENGAGRGIAYSKGAAVFHMLERRIGADAFFAALRSLTAERTGKYTNWTHLQHAFEEASGQSLDDFFAQWVRGGGAPRLELTGADWSPESSEVTVWLSQGDTDFALEVPLRLHYGDRSTDVVVALNKPEDRVTVPCEPSGLTAVELDPDFHLFRKLKPAEVMPTSSLTKRTKRLLIAVPEGDLGEGYQTVLDEYKRAVEGPADEPNKGAEVNVVEAERVTARDLAGSNVLILGDAVRSEAMQELLSRSVSPVEWSESGFSIEGQSYDDPGNAVFFTVHHPDKPDGGVTVYYGNSETALANAAVLSYYPNSLLVFHTPEGEAGDDETGGGHGTGHTEVELRIDFESHDRIDF